MKVSRSQIVSGITRMSQNVPSNRLAQSIAAYLLESRRSGEVDSLMRDLWQERINNGVIEVSAASAHELDASAIGSIKAEVIKLFPNAKEVIVSTKLEPALIGGVRLEFANQILDLSIKSKLNRLRQLITYGKDVI